jgi:hypothetical protein
VLVAVLTLLSIGVLAYPAAAKPEFLRPLGGDWCLFGEKCGSWLDDHRVANGMSYVPLQSVDTHANPIEQAWLIRSGDYAYGLIRVPAIRL